MRVVTFNIQHGRRPSGEQIDIDSFRELVAGLDADVLALQEVDHFQPRSLGADWTALAAEAMGAADHRFVAALSGSPGATWDAATGEEQPQAAAYGIALLTRCPVVAWEVIRLPRAAAPVPFRIPGHRVPRLVREEPRVAVAAVLDTPDGPMTVANTHLSFIPWWGRHQLRSLMRALTDVRRPLLLTGDLNMDPFRAVRITGLHPLHGAPTFPAEAPAEQLDHVLADGPLRARFGESRLLPISDHRALVVEID